MGKKSDLTALIVGAGAVQNAWAPVLRVLQPYYDFPLTSDGANSVLARIVYLLRWWSQNPSPVAEGQLKEHKDLLFEIRRGISQELKAAQEHDELTVRPEFESIADTMLMAHSTSFMLVTTNWDTVVPGALSRHLHRTLDGTVIPLHIHGSITNPDRLYLPTEVTFEPYRTHEEEQAIGGLHGSIWRGLEQAHRVIVYGLSLSPLDAELAQTLAAGWSNPNLREISVVTPDHELVAHRVNLLLDPRREVIVKGYVPGDLKTGFDYTVKRRETKESESR
jgi:hypothetical protein